MNDDFGTINAGRQQMSRELEALKQRYLIQRDTLAKLEAEAPSEELASRYREIQNDIDTAVSKLGELASTPSKRTSPSSARIPVFTTPAGAPPGSGPNPSSAADRPLRSTVETSSAFDDGIGPNTMRLAMMLVVAAIVLTALGLLVWKFAGSNDKEPARIVETTNTASATATTATIVEEPAAVGDLSVNPQSHDFGVIRKGTRAVRQFRVENQSDSPMTIQIARSTCRCLWFDYDSTIPAKNSSILAVTVDGARAKSGTLKETVTISNKVDKTESAKVTLAATIE